MLEKSGAIQQFAPYLYFILHPYDQANMLVVYNVIVNLKLI